MSDLDFTANGGGDAGSSTARPDGLTLGAFALAAIFAGGNAVAVRQGISELPPFWGASIRFLTAAAILLVVVAVLRRPLPRGRALAGVLIYGVLSFGLTYMFLYLAVMQVSAATAMVTLAVVPLLTLGLAVVQRVERFSYRALLGALTAALGIGIVFFDQLSVVSAWPLVALLGGALCMAQSNIVVKQFPRVSPLVQNAIGMAAGGLLLLAFSAFANESWGLPTEPAVQIGLVYLILVGSIGLFLLYLFVLGRWTASATSFVMLLAPFTAAGLGLLVLGETVGLPWLIGGALAIAGVYVGTVAPRDNGVPAKR